ncbi:MAG: hypothetical protein K5770_04575 [Lachnospiraceae bacterium]|nr:hypothetical protein [Lachnospiraceae bacterium]
MDKYEYQVCADQIKNYIAEQKYVEAMEVADTIDWHRVKSVSMLCTVSEIYKYNKRYEESRDILLLAYDRHPSGRMIIYSLCELSIKMNDIVQAVEYYKEFVRVAPGDTGSYILLYKIYDAQDVSIEERIKVLEEFKRRDYKEKWAYELAKLYHKTGQESKCIDECNELILWFGDGKYVDKAKKLKAMHAEVMKQPYSPPYNGPSANEEPHTTADLNMPASEISIGYNTANLQNELQHSMEEYLGNPKDEADAAPPVQEQPGIKVQQVEEEKPEKTQEFVIDSNNGFLKQFVDQLQEAVNEVPQTKDIPEVDFARDVYEGAQAGPEELKPQAETGPSDVLKENAQADYQKDVQEGQPEENTVTEKDPITGEDSEKDNSQKDEAPDENELQKEEAPKVNEAEKTASSEGSVRQEPDKRISLQRELIKKRKDEETDDLSGTGEEPEKEEPASEAEKPDKETESNVKKPDKADTEEDKALLEKRKAVIRKYEAILGQDLGGQIHISLPDEDMVEKQITGQIDIEDVIQTLKERLGIDIEEEEEETGENSEPLSYEIEADETEADETEDDVPIDIEEIPEEIEEELNQMEQDEYEAEIREEEEANAQPVFEYDLQDYGEIEEFEDIEQPDEVDEFISTSNLPLEEIAEYNAMAEQALRAEHEGQQEQHPLPPNYDENGRMKHPSYMVLEEAREARRDFTEEEFKLFGRYDGIEDVKAQLVDVMDNMSMEAGRGNVVIMGDEVSCRKTLAIDIVKAMQAADPSFKGKVAKISGEALNKKNIPATIKKLYEGALIIEEAGGLSAAALTIIAQSLSMDAESILIILEGSRESIIPLLNSNPEMFDVVFDARIDIQEFNNNDLVAYAKGYAREKEHTIDDMGVLALYTRIGELQSLDNKVTIEDIKELVDDAIVHVDKMTVSHLWDVLVAKRYDDDDFIIIREKDFLLEGKKQGKQKKQKKIA